MDKLLVELYRLVKFPPCYQVYACYNVKISNNIIIVAHFVKFGLAKLTTPLLFVRHLMFILMATMNHRQHVSTDGVNSIQASTGQAQIDHSERCSAKTKFATCNCTNLWYRVQQTEACSVVENVS